METPKENKICPICGCTIAFYPAISRKDNKTEICSDCGMIEAKEEYLKWKEKENERNAKK